MRLGSANNHIFHILDAYTHTYYTSFFITLEMQIPVLLALKQPFCAKSIPR